MKKWVFLKSCLNHRKHTYKVMVLMKRSYQEDPIAVIFVVVAWPEVAYGIDFYKKCSKHDFSKKIPVPDRSVLKSSRALPEPIWTRISRSRRWDTSRTPKSNQKIQKSQNPGFLDISSPPDSRSTAPAADMLQASCHCAPTELFFFSVQSGLTPNMG